MSRHTFDESPGHAFIESAGHARGRSVAVPTLEFWWPMEEASGDRIDVIQSVHLTPAYDLLVLFPETPAIDSDTGKVNDGVHFKQYVGGRRLSKAAVTTLAYSGGGFDFSFWIKFSAFGASYVDPEDPDVFDGAAGQVEMNYDLTNSPSEGSATCRLKFTTTDGRYYDNLNFGITDIGGGGGLTDDVALTPVADTWYFIRWFFTGGSYPTGGKCGLQINNGAIHLTSSNIFLPSYTKASLRINQAGNTGTNPIFGDPTAVAEEFIMDELAFAKGHYLSSAEASYLYNSGAGRTYPF